MKKIKLTKENKKHWFHAKAYNNEPILNKHHIIPRHHGGVDEPHNMTPPLTLMEHAEMHLDIHQNGIDGVEGTKGCEKCLKSYKTLKGQHDKFTKLAKFYKGDVDVLELYRYENKEPNVLDDYMSYQSGLHENTMFQQPEEKLERESLADILEFMIDTLCYERHKTMIKMYFGIGEYSNIVTSHYHHPTGQMVNGLTLHEIADEFDLTRERVRQMINKSLERLKNHFGNPYLASYLP